MSDYNSIIPFGTNTVSFSTPQFIFLMSAGELLYSDNNSDDNHLLPPYVPLEIKLQTVNTISKLFYHIQKDNGLFHSMDIDTYVKNFFNSLYYFYNTLYLTTFYPLAIAFLDTPKYIFDLSQEANIMFYNRYDDILNSSYSQGSISTGPEGSVPVTDVDNYLNILNHSRNTNMFSHGFDAQLHLDYPFGVNATIYCSISDNVNKNDFYFHLQSMNCVEAGFDIYTADMSTEVPCNTILLDKNSEEFFKFLTQRLGWNFLDSLENCCQMYGKKFYELSETELVDFQNLLKLIR